MYIGAAMANMLLQFLGLGGKPKWVADYCIICRDIQSHELLPVPKGSQFSSYPDIECSACGVRSRVSSSRYLGADTERGKRIGDLMASTFPALPLECADRVIWEIGAIQGRLTTSERELAIQEPFEAVSYLTKPKRKNVLFIAIGGLFFMALAAALVSILFSSVPALPSDPKALKNAMIIACLCGAVVPLLISDWRGRRKAAKKIEPLLARSLHPLNPTEAELRQVRDWTKAKDLPIRRCFSLRRLQKQIALCEDSSLTNVDEVHLLEKAEAMRSDLGKNGAVPIGGTPSPAPHDEPT